MGSRDPGLYVWLCGEVLAHFLALQFMLSKNPEGLEGSINPPEPPPIGAGSSAVAVHVAMMLDTESEAQKLMETLK